MAERKKKLPEEPCVYITKKLYDKLLEDSDFLDCLRACGVDNWNGYSDARQMYNENEAEVEDKDE
jgi:hypothetical protein